MTTDPNNLPIKTLAQNFLTHVPHNILDPLGKSTLFYNCSQYLPFFLPTPQKTEVWIRNCFLQHHSCSVSRHNRFTAHALHEVHTNTPQATGIKAENPFFWCLQPCTKFTCAAPELNNGQRAGRMNFSSGPIIPCSPQKH